MARYYRGDIEGKFWFAIQPSTDASFFGGYEDESTIKYYFDERELESIEEGLKKCEDELSGYKETLDAYFKRARTYGDQGLAKELDVTQAKVSSLLGWFARLELGRKIHRCVKDTGSCLFEAEV